MGKVEGVVRDELTDDSQVKAELLELQLLLELGDIDEAEYAAREAAIMNRLRDVRDWRERFGMGVAGGPVRVAGTAEGGAQPPGADALLELPPPSTPEGPRVAQPDEASVDLHLDWDE